MTKFLLMFVFCFNAFGSQLSDYRIRSIPSSKLSIYFKKGIFHNDSTGNKSQLIGVRHSFVRNRRFERFVFDLTKHTKVYGSFNYQKKQVTIDFAKLTLARNFKSIGHSKFVKTMDFFPISNKLTSIQIILKNSVAIDVFQLNNPARLVLDIKEAL